MRSIIDQPFNNIASNFFMGFIRTLNSNWRKTGIPPTKNHSLHQNIFC